MAHLDPVWGMKWSLRVTGFSEGSDCTYTHKLLVSAHTNTHTSLTWCTHNISQNQYISIFICNKMTIKRYPARRHTAFWEQPMCTEVRRDLKTQRRRGRRGGAAVQQRKVMVGISTEDDTDSIPPFQTTRSTRNRTETNIRCYHRNWSRPLDHSL